MHGEADSQVRFSLHGLCLVVILFGTTTSTPRPAGCIMGSTHRLGAQFDPPRFNYWGCRTENCCKEQSGAVNGLPVRDIVDSTVIGRRRNRCNVDMYERLKISFVSNAHVLQLVCSKTSYWILVYRCLL